MEQPLVYIIDDEPNIIELIQELLRENYQTEAFESGLPALDKFKQQQPDIVLLDLNLPEQDGFTICKRIKELDPDQQTTIIVITGFDSIEEKMKSYEAGCDDYLVKPFITRELLTKVEKVKQYRTKNMDLQAQQSIAQNMAFQAMTEASQYGIVLQFIKQTFATHNETELAEAIFQTLNQLDLSACVQLRMEHSSLSLRRTNQLCSPIEEEIFELLSQRGRIYDFHNKTIFNDKHASILIKNMPVDDEVMYGRFRDIIAAIVEGVESRLTDFTRKAALVQVMNHIRSTMSVLEKQFRDHEKATTEIMDRLMLEMENGFQFLDLSDEQEGFFIGLIEHSMKSLVALYMNGRDIDDQFSAICNELSDALSDS